jgi:hypothetical protein
MRIFFVFVFSLMCLQLMGQTITYKFRIRYNDYGALANNNFIISGQNLATDPQGIIDMKIASNISYVNIGSSNTQLYEIKYPLEGKAVLPKDPTVFVDIFVAKPSPDLLKTVSTQIMNSQATLQSNIFKRLDDESKNGYDQIVKLLNSKNLDDTVLAKGRLEFFPLISSALNNYLNESRNFNDAFAILGTSLNNKGSYEQLNKAIYSYNEIFDLLNANKGAYEQAIATYWHSKELSLKFSNLIDFTIEDFHKPYILDVNYNFITRLYQANNETNKKKKIELQKGLVTDMKSQSDAISRRLNEIGERIVSMNTLLGNNNQVDN